MIIKVTFINIALLAVLTIAFSQTKDYDIVAYGARVDKNYNNATAIQKAIDAANKAGGGRVIIPDGNYITGPIIIKSNVELHLTDNAVLLGSSKRMDYNDKLMALISANAQQNISMSGRGIINGQGRELIENVLELLSKGVITDPQWKIKRPTEKNRPTLISFNNCNGVKVTGITLKDASGWVQSYNKCKNVLVDSIMVQSTAYWNNDGIDITDCKDVKILNSSFNAADDAICLKSDDPNDACDNIIVENCILRSSASGFKLGTGSYGGFKHIKVNNLTVYNTYRSAIALESVDGAVLEDIAITNVTTTNTGNAIFLRLGHRNKDDRYSTLRHVYIANVRAGIPAGKPDIGYPMEGPLPKVAPHNIVPASITGLPGHPVEDVVLENIEMNYAGGADKNIAYISTDKLETITENMAGYPEFTMFGELPAWGLYVRHGKGITIKNFKVSVQTHDYRPALVFDDVYDLKMKKINIPTVNQSAAIIMNKTPQPELKEMEIPGNLATLIQSQ